MENLRRPHGLAVNIADYHRTGFQCILISTANRIPLVRIDRQYGLLLVFALTALASNATITETPVKVSHSRQHHAPGSSRGFIPPLQNLVSTCHVRRLTSIPEVDPGNLLETADTLSRSVTIRGHCSNGTVLNAGDNVTLIKDLVVKGGGFTAKRGTLVKSIFLTSNPRHVEGRVNGSVIVLVSAFLKKAN